MAAPFFKRWILFSGAVSILLTGCGPKAAPLNTEELQRVFAAALSTNAPAAAPVPPRLQELIRRALQAIETNNLETAGLALQALRQVPALDPDQLTAVQEALSALQNQLVSQAEKGDTEAQAILHKLTAMPGR